LVVMDEPPHLYAAPRRPRGFTRCAGRMDRGWLSRPRLAARTASEGQLRARSKTGEMIALDDDGLRRAVRPTRSQVRPSSRTYLARTTPTSPDARERRPPRVEMAAGCRPSTPPEADPGHDRCPGSSGRRRAATGTTRSRDPSAWVWSRTLLGRTFTSVADDRQRDPAQAQPLREISAGNAPGRGRRQDRCAATPSARWLRHDARGGPAPSSARAESRRRRSVDPCLYGIDAPRGAELIANGWTSRGIAHSPVGRLRGLRPLESMNRRPARAEESAVSGPASDGHYPIPDPRDGGARQRARGSRSRVRTQA